MLHAASSPALSLLAAGTLWRREMVRFFRQRNRVIGAFATPLVFWALLGSGLSRTFVLRPGDPADMVAAAGPGSEGLGALAYFFPGMVLLMVLFTAIFSTISVIEDRREGFLQGVLVSPAPRLTIVLGKILGGASIATAQGLVLLPLWPLVGPWPGLGAMVGAAGAMFLLAVGLTAMGLCIAWSMDSATGFHAVMNLFLMPMWFLSGAVFPAATAPLWMRAVMQVNPLTYGHTVLARLLYPEAANQVLLPAGLAWAVTLAAVAAAVWLAGRLAGRG